jgi:streptomycin 6-kinase
MSCCLAVTTGTGEPAVLKLSGPWTPADTEGAALAAWDGAAAPTLLRLDSEGDALLLERIRPAQPLRTPDSPAELRQIAALIEALHAPPLTPALHDRLPSLESVVEKLLDTAASEAAARSAVEALELQPRLELARDRARSLLDDPQPPMLLHGDLESKNILRCNRRGLVAIDPLPCIGEAAYDPAYWLAFAVEEERRDVYAAELAARLGLDAVRVRMWADVIAHEA